MLSIAVLLRPSADGPASSGIHERRLPDGTVCHAFRYAVVRVWELPAVRLLDGGLATLPLALVSDPGTLSPLEVAERVGRRLQTETQPEVAKEFWAATMLLAGLRLSPDHLQSLLLKGPYMNIFKDSSIYQWIVDEGRSEGRAQGIAEGMVQGKAEGKAEEAVAILLRLGTKRLGPPDEATRSRIQAIEPIERLEAMIERVMDVGSWRELVEAPWSESLPD